MELSFDLPEAVRISSPNFGTPPTLSNLKNEPLKNSEESQIAYIPQIFIDNNVISLEYELYFIDEKETAENKNKENKESQESQEKIAKKINEIAKFSRHAIIFNKHLQTDSTHQSKYYKAYYIENSKWVATATLRHFVPVLESNGKTLQTDETGKVKESFQEMDASGKVKESVDKEIINLKKSFIRTLRSEAGLGCEVKALGTGSGNFLCSNGFVNSFPIIVIAEKEIVLYHPQGSGVTDALGFSKFLESITPLVEKIECICVLQKPSPENQSKKVAIATLNLLVALKEKFPTFDAENKIKRIDCVNFNAVVAVSENEGKTHRILLTHDLQLIEKGKQPSLTPSSPTTQKKLDVKQTTKIKKTKKALPQECLSLPILNMPTIIENKPIILEQTLKEVKALNQNDSKKPYTGLINNAQRLINPEDILESNKRSIEKPRPSSQNKFYKSSSDMTSPLLSRHQPPRPSSQNEKRPPTSQNKEKPSKSSMGSGLGQK